jgi:DnaK suppressor protein
MEKIGFRMDKKRVDYFKKRLQTKQEELLRSVTRSERDGREADGEATQDSADKAANSYTKEFLFKVSDENRRILLLISEAADRIKAGTYGLCVECEEEVQQKRLEAVPWARHCLGCQEKQDKGEL